MTDHLLLLFSALCTYFVVTTVVTLSLFIKIEHWKVEGINKDNATWWEKIVFAFGVFMDVLYNYTAGSWPLFQLPRGGEYMFTYHLQRIVRAKLADTHLERYRLYVAETYCHVLEFFDIHHCREVGPPVALKLTQKELT